VIIFLGAGASNTFGIPTTKGFISLFETEVGENELYKDVKAGIVKDLLDLESLMSVIDDLSKPEAELLRFMSPYTSRFLMKKLEETGNRYYEKAGINEKAKELLHLLKKIIRRECFAAVRDRRPLIVDTYDAFFDGAEKLVSSRTLLGHTQRYYPSKISIFTTNYDTCVETYFNANGIDFAQGIEQRWGYNIFNVDAYKESIVEVAKLHGSVDLFKKGEDIRQFQVSAADYEATITYLGEDLGEEFMVWPIESSGARHATQSPYLDLYSLFRSRLVRELSYDKPVLLLVGSSFRDLTITSIMNEALRLQKKGPRPNVILIDREAKKRKEKIREDNFATLADLVTPIEGEFGAADVFQQLATMS